VPFSMSNPRGTCAGRTPCRSMKSFTRPMAPRLLPRAFWRGEGMEFAGDEKLYAQQGGE
jgi:hypothetical protein